MVSVSRLLQLQFCVKLQENITFPEKRNHHQQTSSTDLKKVFNEKWSDEFYKASQALP